MIWQRKCCQNLKPCIIGRDFARELVETVLLSQLTDSQALDIANTLVKNLEWIKTLIEQKRIELVKKIAYYVKKGETAEEAIERAKKESEEYVKNVENEIIAFLQEIGEPELAKEIADLFECIRRNLPDWVDAAKWLLEVLRKVRSEKGNTGLKIAVEKGFKYSEGCAQASSVINELKEKGVEEAWEELNRIVNYPEGLKIKCILNKEGNRFRIYVSKKLLESYLGSEACWVRIDVKSRTLYKEYDPSTNYFNLPEDIGEDGEEVELAIVKTTTYEFIKEAIKGAGAPLDIAFSSGRYVLVVEGREVCDLTLKNDMHYDRGDYGPAVVFAIMGYDGEHLIKLVYKESQEHLCKVKIGNSYRKIEDVKYKDTRRRLIIEYSREVGETTCEHEILLENPKTVLISRVEEVRDLLKSGIRSDDPEVTGTVGDTGEDYVRFYLEEEIKEVVSSATGIPKEKLKVVQGYETKGPDFYVYYKDELIAIIEVKTTITSERYPEKCLGEGRRQLLEKYFTSDEWKDKFKNVRLGVPIAIYLKDLDKIIETEFKEGVEHTTGDIVWNPNYGS
ncbi:MAG: hypothetical protein QXZ04_02135 [Thermoproteota archaeon]